MIKLLRTLRFDQTDIRVFEHAAEPGEWACSGAFAFAGHDGDFTGKTRQAFANGFLGLGSFGRATFTTVGEATDEEREAIELTLAAHVVEAYGAPSIAAALLAVREEIDFVEDLCRDVPINTVFTVRRTRDEAGAIKEEFRQIRPPAGEAAHARVWTIDRETSDGA